MSSRSRVLSSLADIGSMILPRAFRVLALMVSEDRNTFHTWPTLTSGSGAPSEAQPTGSVYLRTDGNAATTFYIRVNGSWLSSGAGADAYRIISSFPATIEAGDIALEVTTSGTLALPDPVAGRLLQFRTRAGVTLTLTRASSGVEGPDLVLVSSTTVTPDSGSNFRGNGSVWLRFP